MFAAKPLLKETYIMILDIAITQLFLTNINEHYFTCHNSIAVAYLYHKFCKWISMI